MAHQHKGVPNQPSVPVSPPGSPPGPEGRLAPILKDMEQQLRRHSALEDLGPLFAPEAQGHP